MLSIPKNKNKNSHRFTEYALVNVIIHTTSSHSLRHARLSHRDTRRLLRILLNLPPALLGHNPDIRLALQDILGLLQDLTPVLKQRKRQGLPLTVRDEIMALFRKQQIRLPRGTEIARPIPRIHQRRLLAARHLGNRLRIRPDRQALIMPVPAVVVILHRPAAADIQITDRRLLDRHIGHDLDLAALFLAQQMLQQRADDGDHPRRQHDDRDLVLERPVVEGGEARVERDFLTEDVDAFREGEAPAVDHFAEAVAEGDFVVEHVEVALAAFGVAEAVMVG